MAVGLLTDHVHALGWREAEFGGVDLRVLLGRVQGHARGLAEAVHHLEHAQLRAFETDTDFLETAVLASWRELRPFELALCTERFDREILIEFAAPGEQHRRRVAAPAGARGGRP